MQISAANVHEVKPPSSHIVRSASLITEARAKTCNELLADFPAKSAADSRLLRFAGVDGRDVYNITSPFEMDGERMIAGRVEERDSEDAEIVLFREVAGEWTPCFSSPMLRSLQDPCVAFVGDELILGGVRYPIEMPDGSHTWRMEFFRGSSLKELKPFFVGPARMKDIRFCELADGRVAVFTRPQGAKGGKGKIGFAIAKSLDEVTAQMIEEAPLLPGQFSGNEWGGANEAQLLPDGSIGVLGHVARWAANGHRHYYPMTFTIDPETLHTTPIRIIAKRDLFPTAAAKRQDLTDVVFSGGLERHEDGYATLWAGLSDATAGVIRIEDPFAAAIASTLEARA